MVHRDVRPKDQKCVPGRGNSMCEGTCWYERVGMRVAGVNGEPRCGWSRMGRDGRNQLHNGKEFASSQRLP